MRTIFLPLLLFLAILSIGCAQKEISTVEKAPSTAESLCFPPISVDTSTVKMYTILNGNVYRPLANFTCIIPNFFLGIDQLWINGSTIPGLKVITLMMPVDVQPGTYDLLLNSAYDARYVPSGSINFLVDYGTLYITQHDMVTRHIEGWCEFHATNLEGATQPYVDFTNSCFLVDY